MVIRHVTRIAACFALALPAGCSASGTQLGETVDLGLVFFTRQPDLSHTFQVRNVTDRTVEILGESHTCTCTAVELDRRTLRPGESTTVRMNVRIPRDLGRQGVSCRVLTDHPDHPEWLYQIVYDAMPEARVDPMRIDLGSVDLTQDSTSRTPPRAAASLETYTPPGREPAELTNVSSSGRLRVAVGEAERVDELPRGVRRTRFPLIVELLDADATSRMIMCPTTAWM